MSTKYELVFATAEELSKLEKKLVHAVDVVGDEGFMVAESLRKTVEVMSEELQKTQAQVQELRMLVRAVSRVAIDLLEHADGKDMNLANKIDLVRAIRRSTLMEN